MRFSAEMLLPLRQRCGCDRYACRLNARYCRSLSTVHRTFEHLDIAEHQIVRPARVLCTLAEMASQAANHMLVSATCYANQYDNEASVTA